jgi:molybdenum cofactor biosynthesis enzyme
MQQPCALSKAAAIVSAKRLPNQPNCHPLIIIIIELTPRYTEERGRVGVDIMFRELKASK